MKDGMIKTKRNAQTSTVFLLETLDPKRVREMEEKIKNGLVAIRPMYIYNIELQTLTDASGAPVPVDPMLTLSQQLLGVAKQGNLVIRYIYSSRQAEIVSDFLLSAALDLSVYEAGNTIFVFTASVDFFPSVLRRFFVEVELDPPDEEEIGSLLREVATKAAEKIPPENLQVTPELVLACKGLTLHDVETAACESLFEKRKFSIEKFTEYKINILKNYGLQYIVPTRGFESVGGYNYLKNYISRRVISLLRNPERAEKYGLPLPKGILLYGPPGTGKTWFAKALAKELGLPMISISPADFLRGIVGETEARVRQITAIIESLAPVIVFIDEFDQLTLSRSAVMSTDSGVSRRMTNMLLSWLGDENRKSFIVGATNFLRDIDPAFLRPGRLDEIIPVFYPEEEARLGILTVHTSVVRRIPMDGVDLKEIARMTRLWSGAELEKLVLEASTLAMLEDKPVTQEHFMKAMSAIEVNVKEREEIVNNMIRELRKSENVSRTFLDEVMRTVTEVTGERVSMALRQL